ncbi:FecR domain-containing protein [Flavitalea sp. BT771]|uniref:FecR family protein n=1 Tax=Flavitalea sp. BT771 TaxID=3063329 RepID=UPI0026E2FB56|nr:FecR family protein [Flavitalea sp. BT771]MDO6433692.1 FecR domain-containing protein [Flavitalea sp. BT771]MDV6222403.1 FecR domain-containing protein [Flavitalea sp. BT771]
MEKDNKQEWLRLLFEKDEWSEDDRRRLLEFLDEKDDDAMRRLMEDRFREDMTASHPSPEKEQHLLSLIHEKIQPPANRTRLISLGGWRKWAVAAILLLVAGKFIFHLAGSGSIPAKHSTNEPLAKAATDCPPGTQNAILTLADGTRIALDSAANGNLAQQGNTKVIKLNGQIAYASNGKTTGGEPLLNTISTARGNQYMLILSDGTKVWLNAASSMRFPTAFKGTERKVEITGEAYFEIAKDPAMPFKVMAGGGEIRVLGTHFNVNAYADESTVKTTLLEGAVAVEKENTRLVLSPGQQAKFRPQTKSPGSGKPITLIRDVDTGHETAWKDGYFWFDNTDLPTLMRQVARWYDVEVEFKGNVTDDSFSGKVSRSVPLSRLLKVLEQYEINFKIEGKKIIISP